MFQIDGYDYVYSMIQHLSILELFHLNFKNIAYNEDKIYKMKNDDSPGAM